MRLDLRIGTMAAAAALCLPVVAYGQRPVVDGMSQRLTVACGTEGAKVQGMGNTVTLTGPCATVLVEGSDNTVHIATLGRLTVAGMNNKVYWTSGIDGATPKITKEGVGNIVEKKTPADSGARDGQAADDAIDHDAVERRRHGDGDRVDADVVHEATAKPGNPTLTVGSGDKYGRDGRGRRRSVGERDAQQPGPGQDGVEHDGDGCRRRHADPRADQPAGQDDGLRGPRRLGAGQRQPPHAAGPVRRRSPSAATRTSSTSARRRGSTRPATATW